MFLLFLLRTGGHLCARKPALLVICCWYVNVVRASSLRFNLHFVAAQCCAGRRSRKARSLLLATTAKRIQPRFRLRSSRWHRRDHCEGHCRVSCCCCCKTPDYPPLYFRAGGCTLVLFKLLEKMHLK